MSYLPFDTLALAEARSEAEQTWRRGRPRGADDVTRYWWPADADPETGAAVLLIPEGDEGSLAPDEIARLTDAEPAWRVARREAARAAMGL